MHGSRQIFLTIDPSNEWLVPSCGLRFRCAVITGEDSVEGHIFFVVL
jgi:hypothetical protein